MNTPGIDHLRRVERLMAGQPPGEPIAQHGPFIMNTQQEIAQAVADFRAGRLGEASGDLSG